MNVSAYKATIRQVIAEGPFTNDWESLKAYRVPAWYEDAKFGIFIHWGVYSVPAYVSEWYPRNMYLHHTPEFSHHIEKYGPQSQFGYKDFIPQFTAEQFDADQWANLFRRAGAQFVVPVAEHHDGFAMYDTPLSPWNAAKMGPKRDIIGELARAVRKQWLTFGVSSHRAEHWFFFNGGMQFPSDVQDPQYIEFYGPAQSKELPPNEAFLDDWLVRTCELIDRFEPQILYFDWWIVEPIFRPYLQRLAAYYYNRAAQWEHGVAINYKHDAFPEGTAIFDIERGQMSRIRSLFWQSDTAIAKNSWGYTTNQTYKTPAVLIGDLVDVVSKNGALLLNIGPRPDGTIPEAEQELLLTIGRWLQVNGEAVYGTRPWSIYGEGPTQIAEGQFSDSTREPFTTGDVRFTTRGDVLYATLFAWPANGTVTITALGTAAGHLQRAIEKVELLGGQGTLQFHQQAEALQVELSGQPADDIAFVLRITPAK